MDPYQQFKENQKQGWAYFAPLETMTTRPAARLVKYAGVKAGDRVLDVACGTGVTAVTAARLGAKVTGLDLTPQLLERARENSRIAEVDIDWHEGDVEKLPFEDGAFDVVLSQYGHMFAPRPEIAIAEMLRVLKPGGTIAFSTWPPELFTGRVFALVPTYLPPPPAGVGVPSHWGDPHVIRERLGNAVTKLGFDRARMEIPALSPKHYLTMFERTSGPVLKLVEALSTSDPEKLKKFRDEFEALVEEHFEENVVRQDYLMTRALKV